MMYAPWSSYAQPHAAAAAQHAAATAAFNAYQEHIQSGGIGVGYGILHNMHPSHPMHVQHHLPPNSASPPPSSAFSAQHNSMLQHQHHNQHQAMLPHHHQQMQHMQHAHPLYQQEPSIIDALVPPCPPSLLDERDVSHTPNHHGYAKLICSPNSAEQFFIMRCKSIQIGRALDQSARMIAASTGNNKPVSFFGLSEAKNISRVHAEIMYQSNHLNPNNAGVWLLHVLGKNGSYLNDEFQRQGNKVTIKHRDKITMGDCSFFFLEPLQIKPTQ